MDDWACSTVLCGKYLLFCSITDGVQLHLWVVRCVSGILDKIRWRPSISDTLEFLLSVLLVAPLCEEVIFRFGISLKRNAVALWVAIAPAILTWYLISKNCIIVGVALLIGLLIGAYIFFRTDDSLWDKVRAKMSLAVVWISALAFGLLHLNAFTDMSWVILPRFVYMCVAVSWRLCNYISPNEYGILCRSYNAHSC